MYRDKICSQSHMQNRIFSAFFYCPFFTKNLEFSAIILYYDIISSDIFPVAYANHRLYYFVIQGVRRLKFTGFRNIFNVKDGCLTVKLFILLLFF